MSKVIRELARNPQALMKFQATGRLPREHRPSGPLYDLLKAISPRDLGRLEGLTVGPALGYSGSRQFSYGSQALRWVAPPGDNFHPWPSESWKMGNFSRRLYIEDLLDCCAKVPSDLAEKYPRLRRPRPRDSDSRPIGASADTSQRADGSSLG